MTHRIAHDTEEIERVARIVATIAPMADRLLPALLEVQAQLGYVPAHAIAALAEHFNVSRADVHGVVGFYQDLRTAPPGRRVVQICQAEACQAVGCRELTAHAERRLGVALGGHDGAFTLEPAYCFGNCACGPSVRIDDAIHGRVSPARFDALIDAAGART